MEEPNTFIKPSPIHGLGLFAKDNIKSGEVVIQGRCDFSNHLEDWILYKRKHKIKSFTLAKGYCMVNHAESPNTKRDKECHIVAVRDIAQGEEITENYYALPDNENPFIGFDLEKFLFDCKHNQFTLT